MSEMSPLVRGGLFVDFADALEALFGRSVGLIMPQPIRNPHFQVFLVGIVLIFIAFTAIANQHGLHPKGYLL
jgi:hypothetical protein